MSLLDEALKSNGIRKVPWNELTTSERFNIGVYGLLIAGQLVNFLSADVVSRGEKNFSYLTGIFAHNAAQACPLRRGNEHVDYQNLTAAFYVQGEETAKVRRGDSRNSRLLALARDGLAVCYRSDEKIPAGKNFFYDLQSNAVFVRSNLKPVDEFLETAQALSERLAALPARGR